MRNTNWKVQPYTRNRVDSEAEHSDTVTPKTEIDVLKKMASVLRCSSMPCVGQTGGSDTLAQAGGSDTVDSKVRMDDQTKPSTPKPPNP